MEETLQVHPPACDRVTGWGGVHTHHLCRDPGPQLWGGRLSSHRPLAGSKAGRAPPSPAPSAQESGQQAASAGTWRPGWEAEPVPAIPWGGAAARKRARSCPRFLARPHPPAPSAGRERAALRPGLSATSLARPPCPPPTMRPPPPLLSPCWSSPPPGPGASLPGTPRVRRGPPRPWG